MPQAFQPLSTTNGHSAAVHLKSANKYIFRALLSIASAALLIRLAGMLNQLVVSGRFGAGTAMDAYFVASMWPLVIASLIISAMEASVIPVYARMSTQEAKEQKSILFSTLLNLLILGVVSLTLLLLILRHQMIFLSAPALDPFRRELAVGLTPFIYPVLLLMVVNGFLECILNAEGQFGWPAYAGTLVPLTTALLVLIMGKSQGVVILCIGMLIGQCLQLCVVILRAWRAGMVYRPIIDLRNPAIGLILIAAWPVLFGALIDQGGPIVDQIFASFLMAGSISALSYSLKLVSVFTGVIFVSVGRAALPYLSRQASTNDMKAFKETLRLYVWAVGIGTTVLAVLVLVLAHPLVQILFQRGAFSADDTNRTASTLTGFAIGLTPMAIGFVTARAFSALGKTRTLMYVTTFSVIANAIFDYIFVGFWQSFGIAVATSAVYFCTMFILLFTLRRMIGKLYLFTPPREVQNLLGKSGIGQRYTQWFNWEQRLPSLLDISHNLRQHIIRIGIIIGVFAAGIAGIFLYYTYILRVAFGSFIILVFLRYRYVLLITWALINAFLGSSFQILTGKNLFSGLTISTLLLMFCLPIKQTFKRLPALAFLFIYLLWMFASIGISPLGVGAFLTLWITFLDYVAIGMLTINVLTTRQRILRLIDAILVPSAFIALYGIYGYITKQNGEADPGTPLLFRIYSIYDVAPTLALFLSVVIPLALYRTFTLGRVKRIGGAIVVLALLVATGLTFTRGAYIGVPLSLIVMALFLPSRRLKVGLLSGMLALAILAALLATVTKIPIFARFFAQDVSTLNGRIYLWQAVLDHFDPTQLPGNGFGATDTLLTKLQVSDINGVISTAPHNLFISALYDSGIIGVTLLTLVFITLGVNLIAGLRKATGDKRMLFATALAVFVSVLVQSLESNDFWISAIGIYFWIIMALPFALCWSRSKETALEEAPEPGMEAKQPAEENKYSLPGLQDT